MMKTLLVTAMVAALAAPALAQVPATPATPATPAQPASPDKASDPFTTADADKSGSLSLAEVKMADATVTQTDFDQYDADKNKTLSKVEFNKWHDAKKASKGDKASSPS
jgi:hypothetical protein